ncbi:hypothetical protein [Pseudomonas cerasi]|uniref:Uncharacterized protein n=1 Tax=Pseudomonas cerasi TaxID=1583341 RepID=A0A193SM98_9PSED|nr:hypothetical protein [Pseudomonas cerasi]CZT27988.1 hypothetical protein PCPL58_1532 [Pseudomonas cerasi]SOS17529.1 hypothetical protein PL963_01566 [Pseudomonas cerasi]
MIVALELAAQRLCESFRRVACEPFNAILWGVNSFPNTAGAWKL